MVKWVENCGKRQQVPRGDMSNPNYQHHESEALLYYRQWHRNIIQSDLYIIVYNMLYITFFG